ncbi:MAG TPA: dienelactone hydrolase family protein [Terriglobales bacterium]|nr:dienelactone hydrolase family protein [Terriglobales bacterium]
MSRSAADAFVHEYLPPPQGGDAVTLLLLHGPAGEAHDLLRVGPLLDEGAGLLAPRGRVLEDGEPRFFRRSPDGPLDDRRARTAELAAWLRAAAKHHGFDLRRIVAVGHGNGADMATSLLLLEPELLEAAVLFRPRGLPAPEHVPPLRGRAVFIAAGRADTSIPPAEPERLAVLLRSAGADVVLHWDNAGSAPDRREVAAARAWLARRRLAHGLRVHDPPL